MTATLNDFDVYSPAIGVPPRAVYVHVPFCLHRCGYCDFTLVAERDDLIPAWLTALQNELSRVDRVYTVDTVFIGGGTPTHLTVEQLQQLVTLIRTKFELSDGAEFSMEANPDGLDNNRLDALRDLGVNRLSLGAQSFDDSVLRALERQHTSAEAIDVVRRAARRFENLSLDLIFGVPGLSEESWQESLRTATSLPLTHVSTYGLTFEKGTDFFRRLQAGSLQTLPDETERTMYSLAMQHLSEHGFQHYEISNFARRGFACRHNMVYWAANEYFAFGPGAARYVNGVRSTNARNVIRWINSWTQHEPALQEVEQLSSREKIREAIFLGLRLNEGICLDRFRGRFGVAVEDVEPQMLKKHLDGQLLVIENGQLKLTGEGRFLADTVVTDFM